MRLHTLQNVLRHSQPSVEAPASSAPDASDEPVDTGVDTPSSAPAEDTSPAETDFEALSREMEADDISDGSPEVEESAPTPAPEAPPAVAPTTPAPEGKQPPAATPPPATPTPPAAAAPVPAAPAAPQAPATPAAAPAQAPAPEEPLTAEKIEAAYGAYQAQILPQLEAMYKLTPEQVEALDSNPSEAIPKIAARIHYQAQVAAYTGIMSQLPKIVSSVMERAKAVEKAEETFYGRWPDLRKAEYAEKVNMTLRAFRQANPQATTEDMVERAGVMAMLSLGLDPRPPAPSEPPPVPQRPARPSGVGGSGAPRAQAGAVNIWEQLANDFMED